MVLQGVEGARNISDDIIVFGKNQVDHDEALRAVLQNCGDFANVTFANVFGRLANAMSRLANVLLVTSPTPNI